MKDYKYKVFNRCITYNHGPFIKEALEGFANQKTSFPVVTAIIDDASQDDNQQIINEYFDENFDTSEQGVYTFKDLEFATIRFARHKSNVNCYFAIVLLKINHQTTKRDKMVYVSEWNDNSEYLILCEGDDNWCNPNKLQMQVDFMDSHPEYSMCCTDFNLTDGGWRNHTVNFPKDDNCFPYSILNELEVGTVTALFRKSSFDTIPKLWIGKGWKMSDTPMWIELSKVGKIKYMPVVTANYRVLQESASHGSLEKEKDFLDAAIAIHQYYANYYNIELPYNGYDKNYYTTIMKLAWKHKDKPMSKEYFKKAVQGKCVSVKLLVFYLCTNIQLLGDVIKKKTGKR